MESDKLKGRIRRKWEIYLLLSFTLVLIFTVKASPVFAGTPPTFIKAEATSKQLVYLTFNEAIQDPNIAGSTISISGGLSISQVVLTSDARIVRLVLSNTQAAGNQYPTPASYTVTVQNIKDQAGNILTSATQNFDAFTPHGKYAPYPVTSGSSTRMCGQCHDVHYGKGEDFTNNYSVTKVCLVCHGSTGISVYQVQSEFTARGGTPSVTLHKALDYDYPGDNVISCTNCHDPHGDKIPGQGNSTYPMLLRSTWGDGTVYYQGNNVCLACHGNTDFAFSGDPSYYSNTGGNHINANAVHFSTTVDGGVLNPASGTQITCVQCHEKHGSQYPRLLNNSLSNSEEQVCYQCHGNTTNNNLESGKSIKQNIYDQFNIPPAPSTPTTVSVSTTGGHLAGDTTYYFQVTAASSYIRGSMDAFTPTGSYTPMLESLPSPELAVTVPAGTNTNAITISIPKYTAVSGLDQFKVYMSYRMNAPGFTLGTQGPLSSRSTVPLPAGTYKVIVAGNGPFGQTFPSLAQTITTTTGYGIKVNISNSGTAWPQVTSYQTANYFKVYAASTSYSGTPYLIGTIMQNPARLPSVKTFYDDITSTRITIGETVRNFPGANGNETYQASVTAASSGNTTFTQSAAPITTYPVPLGSNHQINPNPADPTRAGSKVECTNCHGPHTVANVPYSSGQAISDISDPLNTKKYFVSTGTSNSTMTVGTMTNFCLTCHSFANRGLGAATSSGGVVPYSLGWPSGLNFTNNASGWFKDNVFYTSDHGSPTVGNLPCTTCHDPHGSRNHLLLKVPYDGFDYQGNCLRCHNGSVVNGITVKNIAAEFQKTSRHPVLDTGVGDHSINENYNNMGGSPNFNRHAQCEDCHDPHSVNSTPASPPYASGAIKNVTGVDFLSTSPTARPAWTSLPYNSSNYVFLKPITYEYELCYKCHSSYAYGDNIPTSTSGAMETDIAMQFNPNNPSYHPVEAVGKNPNIPTSSFNVVNGVQLTATSRIYCFDCHGDNLKNADGTTNTNIVRGPHGSINKFLLKAPYDNGEWSGQVHNDLCLICHNANVYFNASASGSGTNYRTSGGTNLHAVHVDEMGSTKYFCGNCHGLYVHGNQRPHLITLATDAYPYGQWSVLTRWTNPGAGNYSHSSCSAITPPDMSFSADCASEHP